MLSEYAVTQALLKNARRTRVDGAKLDGSGQASGQVSDVAATVLLVSPDSGLVLELQKIFISFGLGVDVALDVDSGMEAMQSFGMSRVNEAVGTYVQSPAIVLLDTKLPGIGSGRLLAAVHESGVHQRCAVALIADRVSDDWIARLREGVIDDIVPRNADAATWRTHISTMQRGHALARELEQMREMATLELEHDAVTGTFNREAMMAILFRETDRVQRLHGALSLLLVGVEDMAHWRVELGQGTCDQLMRQVADRVMRLLRSYDVLGRAAGDEFLVLLPGCSTVNATLLAERVRMDVFGEPMLVTGPMGERLSVRLTANFGITASRGRSPVVVMEEAEETLRKAKLDGPDGVRLASEPVRPTEAEDEELAALYPAAQMIAW